MRALAVEEESRRQGLASQALGHVRRRIEGMLADGAQGLLQRDYYLLADLECCMRKDGGAVYGALGWEGKGRSWR